jgi:hypothetical protein
VKEQETAVANAIASGAAKSARGLIPTGYFAHPNSPMEEAKKREQALASYMQKKNSNDNQRVVEC